MQIVCAASAFPSHVYTQHELSSALKKDWKKRLLQPCPQLARNLRHAVQLDKIGEAATATCRLRSVTGEDVALIGEAYGSVDAITGERMTSAFHQAVRPGAAHRTICKTMALFITGSAACRICVAV